MKYSIEEIRNKLAQKGLKVTPQRLAILDAIYKLGNHPTADNIIAQIRRENPNIASGTVYKVLDSLIEKNLVKKVTTEKDVMRYDGIMENHHHLYCSQCDEIRDYVDEELDSLIRNYFRNKKIEGFDVSDIVLQINGSFEACKE